MNHLENCDFERRVKIIEKMWSSEDAELSSLNIYFKDEYKNIPLIPFVYCPCCGVKIRDIKDFEEMDYFDFFENNTFKL